MTEQQQLNLDGLDKIQFSINVLKEHEPEDGYYLAFSGGKDSQVLYAMAELAGVKFQGYYHPSPIDPPQQIQFIRQHYPNVIFEKPVEPFWKAFHKKGFPLRKKRWCCEYIKESGGGERVVLIGTRSEESRGRRRRHLVETENLIKTRFGKPPRKVVHPILLWTETEVWDFIKGRNMPYCAVYDMGFKRLGCIMCPLASPEKRLFEYFTFQQTAKAWERAFERHYESKKEKYATRWKSADEMFWWWMGQNKPVGDRLEGFSALSAKISTSQSDLFNDKEPCTMVEEPFIPEIEGESDNG